MSACCQKPAFDGASPAFRRLLWLIIGLNATMFLVELGAGVAGESMALQADALDFLGDSATYAITLMVIGRALPVRARAALFKGLTLAALGLWVLGATLYRVFVLGDPDPITMGGVGLLALAVNLGCALLLLRYREGDANVRSVWLCSRNDAIGNVAVVLAATGVFASQTPWPDLLVAGGMAALFLSGSISIVRQANAELRGVATQAAAAE